MPSPSPSRSAAAIDAGTDMLVEHGNGEGRIVLLHAAGSGPRALDRLARSLAEMTRMRALAPSFERDGQSLIGGAPDPFAAATALARRLLGNSEGPASAPRILVGHSMGGLVALKALLAGVRADALVLYEPIVLSLLDPTDAEDAAALAWDRACIADFRAALASGRTEDGVRRFIEAYGDMPWPALPEAARNHLVGRAASLLVEAEATNAAPLDRSGLVGLAIPTLLVAGTRSPPVLARMAARLAAALPNVGRITIDGAGHMGPMTHARDVAGAAAGFLAGRRIS